MKSVERFTVLLCFSCVLIQFVNGQEDVVVEDGDTDDDEEDELSIDVPYCFNFTWLGPRYDNSSNYNSSCTEWKSENSVTGIPCADPFIITYDGSEPDIDYLWANYKSKVVCRQATGDSCIKWSYYFNNALQNETRMCGRAYTDSGDPVSSGCYSQVVNGYTVKFCICQSSSGGLKPCNNANTISGFKMGLTISSILLFCYYALTYS